jgi:hypothetical protein
MDSEQEQLANQLAYGLDSEKKRRANGEYIITLPSGTGWTAELIAREKREFVRMNLTELPKKNVLEVSGLECWPSTDGRFAWCARVTRETALGARLLLEAAT